LKARVRTQQKWGGCQRKKKKKNMGEQEEHNFNMGVFGGSNAGQINTSTKAKSCGSVPCARVSVPLENFVRRRRVGDFVLGEMGDQCQRANARNALKANTV